MNEKIEKLREELDELVRTKADYNLILEKSIEFDKVMNQELKYL